MRRLVLMVASLLFALGPARVSAQQAPPPAIITQGLDLLRTSGASAALDAWMKGWTADAAAAARTQLLRGLDEVLAQTGSVSGHDYLGSADWGPHVRRLYFTVLGKDQPFYARFDVYLTGGEWRVMNIALHTIPTEVFPPGLLMPGRP